MDVAFILVAHENAPLKKRILDLRFMPVKQVAALLRVMHWTFTMHHGFRLVLESRVLLYCSSGAGDAFVGHDAGLQLPAHAARFTIGMLEHSHAARFTIGMLELFNLIANAGVQHHAVCGL
jgi:hypothetical protein